MCGSSGATGHRRGSPYLPSRSEPPVPREALLGLISLLDKIDQRLYYPLGKSGFWRLTSSGREANLRPPDSRSFSTGHS